MKKRKDLSVQEIMKPYRQEIDALDLKLLKLLGRRFEIMREVGDYKLKHGLPPYIVDRVNEVRENAIRNGAKYGINKNFLWAFWSFLIYQSCATEEEVQDARRKAKAKTGKKK